MLDMLPLTPYRDEDAVSPETRRLLQRYREALTASETLVQYLHSGACAGMQMPSEFWSYLDVLDAAISAAGGCTCHHDPMVCARHGATHQAWQEGRG